VRTRRVVRAHVTAKVNPANELFTGTHPNTPAFHSAFLSQVATLSRSNQPTSR